MKTDQRPRRKPPTRGTDPWTQHGREAFCHWDRWYLMTLVMDYGGSWSALEATFGERLEERSYGSWQREDAEAKLSHLVDLRERVTRAGIDADDLLGEDRGDRALLRKARTKLFDRLAMDAHPTEAMRNTPRRLLSERARRGNWAEFVVSPEPFDSLFMAEVSSQRRYSTRATLPLVQRLERLFERLVAEHEDDTAALLAVHRAFLTAAQEALDRADDSFGELGSLLERQIAEYCDLPWERTGISLEAYYVDLLELAVWDVYGVSWEPLRGPFSRLSDEGVEAVEAILRAIRGELLDARLEYPAEHALTLLGRLHVFRGGFDRFVELARDMGSREWERITVMAEAALEAKDRDLAIRVFEAANQPGLHCDHLAERCRELTGRELSKPRYLTVLK